MLEIRKINSDNRGEIFQVFFLGRHVGAVFSTKKGFFRGGHHHPKTQNLYVISGSFEYMTMEIGKPGTEKTEIIREGDFVEIQPNVVHMTKALEDGVLFESAFGGYETSNYAPWRKIVEKGIVK